MNSLIVAIDGPAGAGKSTVSKSLAAKIGIPVLDTGALFRALALYCLNHKVDIDSELAIKDAFKDVKLEVSNTNGVQSTFLNGVDVSGLIRTPVVSQAASKVGTSPFVRAVLTEQVRHIASLGSYVVEGRDIGSAMLPDADVKFFLTASAEERARRRCLETKGTDKEQPYETVLQEIIFRDHQDSNRAVAPLIRAEDAVLIDSSSMSAEEVVETMYKLIVEK